MTQKGSDLISDLTETFENLRRYKMMMNPLKCVFGVPAGKLLGFIVSHRGIEVNPENIKAIMCIKRPTCLKDVQRLTGCVAAISRFVNRLGEKALPLYNLLKKTDKFVWDNEADAALQGLKEILTSPPILAAPEEFEPMLLYLAASNRVITLFIVVERKEEGLNFSSRNLLDPAAGGTFMYITLGAATKLLDNMMINYSEWHTERASQVSQEEHVDVNFIKNNNFNNNAYRNNSGNNYRTYPSNNSNGYGSSYGNSYNNNRSVPPSLEAMLKEFISTQTAFNTVEEKLGKIDVLASKVDSLAADVNLLKLKAMPNETKDIKSFATANAIQVRINENIRLMAELHARWEREEKFAKENNVAKVWTITATSNVDASHVSKPRNINGKIIGVSNVSTPNAKRAKLPETAKSRNCL
ncbi:hypothetical protein QYE76_035787 [Lolium multiflorum]|uniref:Uncharacterized protein n=1 Tax=Lolium multiflorum TaxID=4521 RepID=A0AAD8R2B6_LOLMU|nr:hypothetical protein QYE76_035787 [Lolium multiflorum]